MIYKAAVIGLGNIGIGYDYDDRDGSRVLTHAAGFNLHEGFDLVAAVDADAKARGKFEQKYNRPSFSSIREMYDQCNPDVISIAVPTILHYTVFMESVAYKPKAILCEKPFGGTLAKAKEMKAAADLAGITLLVNYIRRFEPGVLRLKQAIEDGEYGTIYKGTLWYSKGILNNGSHFIDMLRFLLGEVQRIELLDKGIEQGNDPEPDLKIRFGSTDMYFLAGREACFSIKEMELVSTSACIRYAGGGRAIQVRRTVPNPTFPGYVVLEEAGTFIPTELARYQAYVTEALYQALETGIPPASNGTTTMETLSVVDEIIRLTGR